MPTLPQLMVLKYADEGEVKKIRIISAASHRWKDIASLICDGDINIISKLEQKHQSNPNECLRGVFVNHFINKKPQNYSQDWHGLIELLHDVDLETLAKEVEDALSLISRSHNTVYSRTSDSGPSEKRTLYVRSQKSRFL